MIFCKLRFVDLHELLLYFTRFATEAPRELEILRKLLSNTENKQDESSTIFLMNTNAIDVISDNSGHFGGDDELVTSTSTTSTERKDSTCSTGSGIQTVSIMILMNNYNFKG